MIRETFHRLEKRFSNVFKCRLLHIKVFFLTQNANCIVLTYTNSGIIGRNCLISKSLILNTPFMRMIDITMFSLEVSSGRVNEERVC